MRNLRDWLANWPTWRESFASKEIAQEGLWCGKVENITWRINPEERSREKRRRY